MLVQEAPDNRTCVLILAKDSKLNICYDLIRVLSVQVLTREALVDQLNRTRQVEAPVGRVRLGMWKL